MAGDLLNVEESIGIIAAYYYKTNEETNATNRKAKLKINNTSTRAMQKKLRKP